MTAYEIATIILIPLVLSMAYAFKRHNEELLEHERKEQKKKYYQYVKKKTGCI